MPNVSRNVISGKCTLGASAKTIYQLFAALSPAKTLPVGPYRFSITNLHATQVVYATYDGSTPSSSNYQFSVSAAGGNVGGDAGTVWAVDISNLKLIASGASTPVMITVFDWSE